MPRQFRIDRLVDVLTEGGKAGVTIRDATIAVYDHYDERNRNLLIQLAWHLTSLGRHHSRIACRGAHTLHRYGERLFLLAAEPWVAVQPWLPPIDRNPIKPNRRLSEKQRKAFAVLRDAGRFGASIDDLDAELEPESDVQNRWRAKNLTGQMLPYIVAKGYAIESRARRYRLVDSSLWNSTTDTASYAAAATSGVSLSP